MVEITVMFGLLIVAGCITEVIEQIKSRRDGE